MGKTLSNQSFKMALLALEKLRVDPWPILAQAQISKTKLLNPMGRIQIEKERLFWKIATEITSDLHLGLHLAQHVPFGSYPLLEYIGASAQSLFQALVFFTQYGQIVYGEWHPKLREGKNFVFFTLGSEGSAEASRQTDEFGLALLMIRLRHFSGGAVPLKAVHFRHSLTEENEAYKQIFFSEVLFGQKESGLLFDVSVKNIPCKNADHFLLGSLLSLAEKIFQKLPNQNVPLQSELISRITTIIEMDLALGEPQMEKIASSIGMSARSLQRKLEGEGTSLTQVVVQVRKLLALELLKDVNRTYEEIALSLGYSTTSAFNRAFKQWFKLSPSEYQKTHIKAG